VEFVEDDGPPLAMRMRAYSDSEQVQHRETKLFDEESSLEHTQQVVNVPLTVETGHQMDNCGDDLGQLPKTGDQPEATAQSAGPWSEEGSHKRKSGRARQRRMKALRKLKVATENVAIEEGYETASSETPQSQESCTD